MHDVEAIVVLLVAAIVIIGVVSAFAQRLGVAAPLILVVVGTGLALMPGTPDLTMDPQLILAGVLPSLLYAAARKVPFVDFRRNLLVISALAVGLVIGSAIASALVVQWFYPAAGLALALALGAVVSPPDAVAAISLGKRLGLPPRLLTILEGEGLVNDATALVLLSTSLSMLTLGSSDTAVTPGTVVLTFVWAVVGALLVGLLVGAVAVISRGLTEDPTLDIALALAVPFVAFVLAEEVGASGVVAVVIAGLWVGNRSTTRVAAALRRTEMTTWGTFTMLVENGVFLAMGYLLPNAVRQVLDEDGLQGIVLVGVLVSLVLIAVRFAAMPLVIMLMRQAARRQARLYEQMHSRYEQIDATVQDRGLADHRLGRRVDALRRRLERRRFDITAERDQALGWRDSIVLSTAGMRGVVTIAAAQTLPAEHEMYDRLVLIAFVVALVTLLPQGLALPSIVRRLSPPADALGREREEFSMLWQRLAAAAREAVQQEIDAGGIDPSVQNAYASRLKAQEKLAQRIARGQDRELTEQYVRLYRAQYEAERAALEKERRRGELSSEVLGRASRLLDDHQIQMQQARESGV